MKLKIIQNAYVVNDIDKAMRDMNQALGLGPFIGGDPIELAPHIYRGEPAEPIRFRVAFVQSGDMMIELVERISTGPDALYDMFPAGATGLHHCASFCDDYDAAKAEMAKRGYPVVSEFSTPWGAKIAYVDTRPVFGHMIELYPQDEGLFELYAKTRQARDDWDGETLLVPWL